MDIISEIRSYIEIGHPLKPNLLQIRNLLSTRYGWYAVFCICAIFPIIAIVSSIFPEYYKQYDANTIGLACVSLSITCLMVAAYHYPNDVDIRRLDDYSNCL